jgi:hypothetical protein
VEVDGEVRFACSRRSDNDEACVLPGDVFSVSHCCFVPFGRSCCTSFHPVFRKLTRQIFFLINENGKSFALFQKKM